MMRIRELDGFRGIAILMVLVAHLSGLNGAGLVGVLLFFVLSGFPITRLLAAEHNDRGRIDLRAFYLRRALRLLPALGLLLAVTMALAFVGVGVSDTGSAIRGSLHAALYATDFVVGLGGEFAPELAHLWTLAVEEQFYVVWPLLLLLLMRRGSRASVLRWAGRLLVLAVLARLITIALAFKYGWFFYALPTTWLDCFVADAILALWMQLGGQQRTAPWWSGAVVTGAALLTILVIAGNPRAFLSPATYVVGIPALAASAVCLIGRAVLGQPGLFHRALNMNWLQWFGDRSYGIYLFNSTCVLTVAPWFGTDFRARSAVLLSGSSQLRV